MEIIKNNNSGSSRRIFRTYVIFAFGLKPQLPVIVFVNNRLVEFSPEIHAYKLQFFIRK
jgi:hypothetical protein